MCACLSLSCSLPLYLFVSFKCLPACLPVCLSLGLSVCVLLSLSLPACLSVCLLVYVSVCLPVSVCLSWFNFLSLYLSLSACLPVLTVFLSVSVSLFSSLFFSLTLYLCRNVLTRNYYEHDCFYLPFHVCFYSLSFSSSSSFSSTSLWCGSPDCWVISHRFLCLCVSQSVCLSLLVSGKLSTACTIVAWLLTMWVLKQCKHAGNIAFKYTFLNLADCSRLAPCPDPEGKQQTLCKWFTGHQGIITQACMLPWHWLECTNI